MLHRPVILHVLALTLLGVLLFVGCVSISSPNSPTPPSTSATPNPPSTGPVNGDVSPPLTSTVSHRVSFDTFLFTTDARVNDIPVAYNPIANGNMGSSRNIPFVFKNGTNHASLRFVKDFSGTTSDSPPVVDLNITEVPETGPSVPLVQFHQVATGAPDEDTYTYEKDFMAHSNITSFPWENASTIQSDTTTLTQVENAYQQVWNALHDKDKQAYLKLMEEADRLAAMDNGESLPDAVDRRSKEFDSLIDQQGDGSPNSRSLHELDWTDAELWIVGNGKLVAITQSTFEPTFFERSYSPIYYAELDENGVITDAGNSEWGQKPLQLFFYQPTPGKFVPIFRADWLE